MRWVDIQTPLNARGLPAAQIEPIGYQQIYYENEERIEHMNDMQMAREQDRTDYRLTVLAYDNKFYFELVDAKTKETYCMKRCYFHCQKLRCYHYALYFALEQIRELNQNNNVVKLVVNADDVMVRPYKQFISKYVSSKVVSVDSKRANIDIITLILLHQNVRFYFVPF